ncbi:MAG: hypothetical protein MUO72_02660 [Bacteroidales bacterium]|nr:hypothetical protein [Bacteroidales bacterium]
MKTLNFRLLAIILASFILIPGCKDKDEKEVSKFVGNFVISEAKLAEALTVPIVEVPGNLTVPVGTDITQAIQTALLSAVNCSSPDKSYVELREDFSMYFSCEGLNPLNAGTWEEVSATSLKLNMNSAAIPSLPTGFVLTVTDIVKVTGGLTGITSVPLPKAMIAGMIASMQLTLSPSAPDIFMVKISIEFTKK